MTIQSARCRTGTRRMARRMKPWLRGLLTDVEWNAVRHQGRWQRDARSRQFLPFNPTELVDKHRSLAFRYSRGYRARVMTRRGNH